MTLARIKTTSGWVDLSKIGPKGDKGDKGDAGATGPPGATGGQGLPVGGATGQVLSKKTATDYDTQWAPSPAPSLGSWNALGARPGFDTNNAFIRQDSAGVVWCKGWVNVTSSVSRYSAFTIVSSEYQGSSDGFYFPVVLYAANVYSTTVIFIEGSSLCIGVARANGDQFYLDGVFWKL